MGAEGSAALAGCVGSTGALTSSGETSASGVVVGRAFGVLGSASRSSSVSVSKARSSVSAKLLC